MSGFGQEMEGWRLCQSPEDVFIVAELVVGDEAILLNDLLFSKSISVLVFP